jgi:superfamily II DNA or RNA helicase
MKKTSQKSTKIGVKTKIPVVQVLFTPEYLESIRKQSYIGKKGYTIPKSALTSTDIEFLKKELLLKPEVHGASYGAPKDEGAFPVYRENDKKMYLPRFYGIERYGLPDESELDEGMDIDVAFVKDLRDYQEDIVDKYMKFVKPHVSSTVDSEEFGSGGILQVPCGWGKCLGKDTPIIMYDGSIKMVQDIVVGDQIMGDDSCPRNVLTLARGRDTMYKIKDEYGSESYVVNESHILSLMYFNPSYTLNSKKYENNQIIDIPLLDYLDSVKKGGKDYWRGVRVPIKFSEISLNTDPYLLGIQLGKSKDMNDRIPHNYKCNSREKQLELLAGIIDACGHYYEYEYIIYHKNNNIKNDIIFLTRSLGFILSYSKNSHVIQINVSDSNEIPSKKYNINGENTSNPSDLPVSSASIACPGHSNPRLPGLSTICGALIEACPSWSTFSELYEISVEKLPEDDYYGFEIDGNRRFILGDFTVTHNTVMAIKIISLLKKKTMILVHKEFLMNQWIERIMEYAPSAKIGKIQASTYDVDDKDIVIAMIQTMYNKPFPQDTYSQFGLTIIDEVHRIGSEEFSKTLLKTITPYMLGISATVERKDKLTKLLHMFIGPMIYSTQTKPDDPVFVRGIEFKSQDHEFCETETDFRGKPKYSTMISKLCEFGPRKDFIVRILQDLRTENPESQIMILAHNRSLLTYLYQAITHRGFATVGFYVGGMKAAQLKATEDQDIVLATYAMAAEALDIKTLSILVLATPKTDIVQSVGRILRMKHEKPIVIDVVDSHDIFQNQWRQRKTYYRKCNYRIRSIDSIRYQGFLLDWERDATWLRVFEPKMLDQNGCVIPSVKCKQINDNDDDDEKIDQNHNPTIFEKKCMIDIADL